MNITEVLVPAQAIAWLPWAAQYFLYIGSAYAAAILFLIALLFNKHTSHRLRAALVLTMAISAIVGPLALTADLHQPGRAWHFYTHLTTWSWMSLGSLFLPCFSALAVITAWLYLRHDLMQFKQHNSKALRLLSRLTFGQWATTHTQLLTASIFSCIAGLSIALYTGAEISVVAAQPLWHQLASPMLWFITAFLGAIGFTLVMWLLIPRSQQENTMTMTDVRLLKHTSISSGLLAGVLTFIWALNNGNLALFEDPTWLGWIILWGLTLFSMSLASIALLRGEITNSKVICLALLALLACWITRWVTLIEVQTIPKYDVGPYPYSLSLGSNGLLGIIGMLGLWIALAIASTALVQTASSHIKINHK
ncbi:NrfD/PsrC family molybdoenzyme membrane anchor subunit [Vibrio gallicus]|uniref:NrfD/PsrC family molybdoenzyme membrane anchor subunit n=1 Tax=Vibrio gallicus TaxID=190897 RepID=UPI0021C31F98|nr:NrfD/PsrC family molybdoenzyme membrane anchor subunit [Vibrio gallicus]